jgi:hypothetical protein
MSPTDFFGGERFEPWTLAQIYADLVSRGDIALALNVQPLRVTGWISRRAGNKCPLPVTRIGPTDVYSMQEWRDWYTQFIQDRQWLDGHCLEHPDAGNQVRRFFGE